MQFGRGAAKTGPAAVAARCPGDPVWSHAATRRDHVPELIWCVHKCVPVIRRHHHHQLSTRLRGDVREECGMSRMRLENGIACPTRAPAPGFDRSEIGGLCSRSSMKTRRCDERDRLALPGQAPQRPLSAAGHGSGAQAKRAGGGRYYLRDGCVGELYLIVHRIPSPVPFARKVIGASLNFFCRSLRVWRSRPRGRGSSIRGGHPSSSKADRIIA